MKIVSDELNRTGGCSPMLPVITDSDAVVHQRMDYNYVIEDRIGLKTKIFHTEIHLTLDTQTD